MSTTALLRSFRLGVGILLLSGGWAAAQNDPQPGECASGFCGTPKNNGGGGCGCGGGSILVNNTDIGKTYSKTDDYDGDGIADDFDNCPFMPNREQADSDGDTIGDVCDNCAKAANPDQHDVNVNGVGDVCDVDIDGDKILNAADNCQYVPNVNQKDTDTNGLGDVCDPDMDGDKIMNRVDNCPLVFNPDQAKNAPGRFGDACDTDSDKDAIEDAKDNCPAVYNPDQSNINADLLGDACDPDIDGDRVVNQFDNCPLVTNPDQRDDDKDGVGNACATHGFCFVPFYNKTAQCLDPKGVFTVTAAPLVKAATGETVYPFFYANRDSVGIQYTWVITSQPDGSVVGLSHPRGTAAESQSQVSGHAVARFCSANTDCDNLKDDRGPSFLPTHPGKYTITVSADLVKTDALFPSVLHSESSVDVQVDGPVVATSGCNMGGRGASNGLLALGMLFVAGALVRRRRAK